MNHPFAGILTAPLQAVNRFFLNSWKDPNNEFRKNLKLTGVPTLLKYGTVSDTLYVLDLQAFKWESGRNL